MKFPPIPTDAGRDLFRRRIQALIKASGRNQDEIGQAMAKDPATGKVKWESLRDQVSKFKRGEKQTRDWFEQETSRLLPLAAALGLDTADKLREAYQEALGFSGDREDAWHPAFPGIRIEIPAPIEGEPTDKFVAKIADDLASWHRGAAHGLRADPSPPWVWVIGEPGSGRTTLAQQLRKALASAMEAKREEAAEEGKDTWSSGQLTPSVVVSGMEVPERSLVPRIVVADRLDRPRRDPRDAVIRPAAWTAREVEALVEGLAKELPDSASRLRALCEQSERIVRLLGDSRRPPQVIRFVADALRRELPATASDARRWRQEATWRRAVQLAPEGTLDRLGPEWMGAFWACRVLEAGLEGAWKMTRGEALRCIERVTADREDPPASREAVLAELRNAMTATTRARRRMLERVEAWLALGSAEHRLEHLIEGGLLRHDGELLVADDRDLALSWAAAGVVSLGGTGLDLDGVWFVPTFLAWVRELIVYEAGDHVVDALRGAPPAAVIEVAEARAQLATFGVALPHQELVEAWVVVLAAELGNTFVRTWPRHRQEWRRQTLVSLSRVERARLPRIVGDPWEAIWSRVPEAARAVILGWEPQLAHSMAGGEVNRASFYRLPPPRPDHGRWWIAHLAPWQCPPQSIERWVQERRRSPVFDEVLEWFAEAGDERCQMMLAGWDPEEGKPLRFQAQLEQPVGRRLRWLSVIPEAHSVKWRIEEVVVELDPTEHELCVETAMQVISDEERQRWVSWLLGIRGLLDDTIGDGGQVEGSHLSRKVHFGLALARRMKAHEALERVVGTPQRVLEDGRFYTWAHGQVTLGGVDDHGIHLAQTRGVGPRELGGLLSDAAREVFDALSEAAWRAAEILDELGAAGAREALVIEAMSWQPSLDLQRSWAIVLAIEGLRWATLSELVRRGDGGLPREEDLAAVLDAPARNQGFPMHGPPLAAEVGAFVERGLDPIWARIAEAIQALSEEGRRPVSQHLLEWMQQRSWLSIYPMIGPLGLVGGAGDRVAHRLLRSLLRDGSDLPIQLWLQGRAYFEGGIRDDERVLHRALVLAEDEERRLDLLTEASRIEPMPGWVRDEAERLLREMGELPEFFHKDAALIRHMMASHPNEKLVWLLHQHEACCREVSQLVQDWLGSDKPLDRPARGWPHEGVPGVMALSEMVGLMGDLADLEPPPDWMVDGVRNLWWDHVVTLEVREQEDGGPEWPHFGRNGWEPYWIQRLFVTMRRLGLDDEIVSAWDRAPERNREAVRGVVAKFWVAQATAEQLVEVVLSETASHRLRDLAWRRLPDGAIEAMRVREPDVLLADAPWSEPGSWDVSDWAVAISHALHADVQDARRQIREGLRAVPASDQTWMADILLDNPSDLAWLNSAIREMWLGGAE